MDVDAYLGRIGVMGPVSADARGLWKLHRAHLEAVPFENLSIHLGEDISLTSEALFDKVVRRRRGGFCYELNGLFAELLEALGFAVERVGARVHGGGRLGPPFDHLALVVTAPGGDGPWVADVGFGRHSVEPLDFRSRQGQRDRGGVFTLIDLPGGDVDVAVDGVPQYRIERRARELRDFGPTCWWHATSPESHFGRSIVCSRLEGDGRVSLSGRTLIRTDGDGRRTDTVLDSDEQVLAAYREHFGIVLSRVPRVVRPA
uniref:arylamine N-acetyltransferase family protein n=1 Tax=Paractinoplanes polyasparticus TaxID=2856853 RepID=UPI001C864DC9|nr:arylamine N-acetyltransferase [Actinoplanes polyasparticus]